MHNDKMNEESITLPVRSKEWYYWTMRERGEYSQNLTNNAFYYTAEDNTEDYVSYTLETARLAAFTKHPID